MKLYNNEIVRLVVAGLIVGIILFLVTPWLRGLRTKIALSFSHLLGRIPRWLTKPKFVIPVTIAVFTALLYIFWLHDELFPDRRMKVVVCTFDYIASDQVQVQAWKDMSRKIQQEFDTLDREVNLVLLDTVVTTQKKAIKIGKKLLSDLVFWGNFSRYDSKYGTNLQVEPYIEHIVTLIPPQLIPQMLFAEEFIPSISEPKEQKFVIRKAGEIRDCILMISGLAEFRSKRYENAINRFKSINPQNASVLIWTGYAYMMGPEPKLDLAEECFRKAITSDSNSAEGYNCRGVVLHKQGRYSEANDMFVKAIEKDSECVSAYGNWGNNLASLGRFVEAKNKYEKAISIDSTFPVTFGNLGCLLIRLGRPDEAIKMFEKATLLAPGLSSPYVNLAGALIQLGDKESCDSAAKVAKKATKKIPKSAAAYINWGAALICLGKYEQGIDKFQRATEIDSNDYDAYYNWGQVLGQQGKYEEAIKKYKKAVELRPENPEAYNNWGFILTKFHRYGEAIKMFEKVTVLSPTDPTGFENLGRALLELGERDEARQKLLEARALYRIQGKEDDVLRLDELLKGI